MARHILDANFTVFPRRSSKRRLSSGKLRVKGACVALNREGSFGAQSADVVLELEGHSRPIVLGTQRDNLSSPHLGVPFREERDFLACAEVAELDQYNRYGAFYSHYIEATHVDLHQMTRDFALLQVLVADAVREHHYKMVDMLNEGASFDDRKGVDVLSAIILCLREHNVEVVVHPSA